MTHDNRLDEIRARLAAASDGPWKERLDVSRPAWRIVFSEHLDVAHIPPWMSAVEENADFIANAPADIRYLLDLLDERA